MQASTPSWYRGAASGAALVALFAALVGCSEPAADGRRAAALLGADPVTAGQFPSVVAIIIRGGGGSSLCTGTLVHPEWVVTAGHCLDPAVFGLADQDAVTDSIEVVIGSLDVLGSGGLSVRASDTFRDGSGVPGQRDAGLIRLVDPVAGVVPAPVNLDPAAAPIGVAVTMVGYGVDDRDRLGRPAYFTGEVSDPCAAAGFDDELFLCFEVSGGRSHCLGDSGGPSFATIGGVETLVAFHAFGDEACAQLAADQRTDAARDFLVGHVPELDDEAGGCRTGGGARLGWSTIALALLSWALAFAPRARRPARLVRARSDRTRPGASHRRTSVR